MAKVLYNTCIYNAHGSLTCTYHLQQRVVVVGAGAGAAAAVVVVVVFSLSLIILVVHT